VNVVNKVNKVNVVNMWKSATFTAYLHESKGLVNEVNVARGYFACGARPMPNRFFHDEEPRHSGNLVFNYSITRSPNHSIHLNSLLI
jgi:hypothetical protein